MSLDRILLGLLREPASGYDLKALFESGIDFFWPAELSQIYRTLRRLESEGLLRSTQQPSARGPSRRVYSLTAAGRRELQEWLRREPVFDDERYSYVAQLFFMAELDDLEHTLAFLEQLREKRAAQVDGFRRVEEEVFRSTDESLDEASDEELHRHLTLRAGLLTSSARLQWCDEAIALLRRRIRQGKPHPA